MVALLLLYQLNHQHKKIGRAIHWLSRHTEVVAACHHGDCHLFLFWTAGSAYTPPRRGNKLDTFCLTPPTLDTSSLTYCCKHVKFEIFTNPSLFLHSFVFVTSGQNQFPGSVSSLANNNLWFWLSSESRSITAWVSHSQLTCLSMCIVNLWLCGVSKHNGSHTVEAVFISVILQSRLLGAHHVVLTVATAWGQFWDTELLLQHRKSRAITCRAIQININAPISVWEYSLLAFLYKTSPSPSPNRKRFLSSDGGLIRCWK